MSSNLQLSDTNAIQALTALNWWTCYGNRGTNNIAWIPTVQALWFKKNKNTTASDSGVASRLIDPLYYEKLMKLIPYGIADGTLSSSFPDPYELEVYLMRALGVEESLIQSKLAEKGVTDASQYMMTSVVKQQGKQFADYVIEIANTQGVAKAQQVIDTYKSNGQIPSSSSIQPNRKFTLTTAVPSKRSVALTTRPSLSGANDVNQRRQPAIHPAMFLAIPICIMIFRKSIKG